MSSRERVAVVGAGVSGLTAAHLLLRAGYDVTVIDRRANIGGRIHSENCDGYLLEHGANAMVTPAPSADTLIKDLALSAERIEQGERVRRRYLVRAGRVRALGIGPLGLIASGFLSLRGRMRLLAEPFARIVEEDETVADFVDRRFGREFLDHVVDPLVGGLYTGDPAHLGMDAVFPRLKRLERDHGSVIRGILRGRNREGRPFSPRKRKLISFRSGLGALPHALGNALAGRLLLETRLERIEPSAGGTYRLRLRDTLGTSTQVVGSVVLALPAYAAAAILARLDADVGAALASIPHPPVAVVFLGYERSAIRHPLDGLGVLSPKSEGRSVLGFLFSSTLFPGRAPGDRVLLTAYVGGARQPELTLLDRATLADLVAKEARDFLGAHTPPRFSRLRYWRQGLPQPGVGHNRVVARLRSLEERWPGLFVTGNYLAGVSTGACIEEATATAARVTRHLEKNRPQMSSGGLLRAHER
jgi:oxygen-dependent protoporphyrinogen oxidase